MIHARLSRTTHTVDVSQVDELNDWLQPRRSPAPRITAAELDLTGAELLVPGSADVTGHGVLPAEAVLTRVAWQGSPEYPYIHGHFAAGEGEQGSLVVQLHTLPLRALSARLHLRHVWGTGSLTP